MGKGDIRSKRGKINRGTHGKTRSKAKEGAKNRVVKPNTSKSATTGKKK
jgi:ribosomal small subunit protein bTHX